MANSSARNTLGKLFGAVASTADTATNVLDTVNDTVGMASAAVRSMAKDQQDRLAIHRDTYRTDLIRDAAAQQAVKDEEFIKFSKESKERESLVAKHLDRFESLFSAD